MYGGVGITDERRAQSHCTLSKYRKCDNQITDEYHISNGTGRERIVTGDKKGNILSNRTERQIERNRKGEYIL